MSRTKSRNRFLKIVVTIVAAPFVLLFILASLLYFPPLQEYAIRKAERAIANNSGLDITIGKIELSFPLSLTIEDFLLTDENDTIVCGENIRASISVLPLLKGEIYVNYIAIEKSRIDTRDLIEGTRIIGDIGFFRGVARGIDLIEQEADIRQLYIRDTDISISIGNRQDNNDDSETQPALWAFNLRKGKIENTALGIELLKDTTSISTRIEGAVIERGVADIARERYELGEILLTNSEIAYNKGASSRETSPLDHIEIEQINLSGKEIEMLQNTIKANIEKVTFAQREGIEITNGTAIFTIDENKIEIPDIYVASQNGSRIEGSIYAPIKISNETKENIGGSIIAFIKKRDVTPFLSVEQQKSIVTLPDSILESEIAMHGTVAHLSIDKVLLDIPLVANFEIEGDLKNINNEKKREGDIAINGEITNIFPLLKKSSERTPVPISINGRTKLKENLIYTDINLDAIGNGHFAATYNIDQKSYEAKADFKNFGLAGSIPAIALDNIDARISLSGQGYDIFNKETYYQLTANIDTVRYDGYSTSEVLINAFQANSFSLISLCSTAPYSNLSFTANSRIDTSRISTKIDLLVNNISLKETGISKEDIKGGADISIEASSDMKETHEFTFKGSNIEIDTKEGKSDIEPIFINFATSPAQSHIDATNGDMNINGLLAGGYKNLLSKIEVLNNMIEEARKSEHTIYYANDLEKEIPEISIDFECGQQNILAKYLKANNNIGLKKAELAIKLDSTNGIKASGALYDFATNDTKLDTIRISAIQEKENIKYFAGVRSTATTTQNKKQSFNAALFGNLRRDTLNTTFALYGNERENITKIVSRTILHPEGLNITFAPQAKFIGTDISINDNNYIKIGKNSSISADVRAIDKENAGVNLYTINDSIALQDISLELFNVKLKTATSMLPFVPDIAGTLYTDIHYRKDSSGIMFSSDIRGKDIVYEGNVLGDETIEIIYLPKEKETSLFSILLQHNEEETLNIQGYYNGEKFINTSGTITQLPLRTINTILGDKELNIDGFIDGEITLKGDIESPETNGYIEFDSVYIDAPLLGSKLHPSEKRIEIDDNKILFDNFDIFTKGTSPLKVDGNIDIAQITNPRFNLRMQAKDCEVINNSRTKGAILYGKLFIDINSSITGPMQALKLYGNATILGKSNITYVMNDNSIADVNELEGLVEFVNFKDSTKTEAADESLNLGNITMGIALDVEDGTKINADFDANRTSYINLQGGGHLNMGYTSESGITLTGRYTLNNGEMRYNLPIIPLKTFNISPGSYVSWTGDALNPTINITALERVGAPVSIEGIGRQVVAFDVGVVLKNSLDNITPSFTIQAPENAAIQDELNTLDAETLNKYAITMLITGAYVGDNGGLTVSNALTSFLDSKINNIAGNAMKDVSVNVGITDVENSDTGDSYMNYSFSFAKKLWNDRFTIIIGGEVNSGNHPEMEQSFINNVSLEWRITPNSNRFLRIFYDKNYESILEGEITETGVGYVYKRKLDSLNELLFIKKHKK